MLKQRKTPHHTARGTLEKRVLGHPRALVLSKKAGKMAKGRLQMAKPKSRQARWRAARRAKGLCVQCGLPAGGAGRCEVCAEKKRNVDRVLTHSNAWKPGGSGRPPGGKSRNWESRKQKSA